MPEVGRGKLLSKAANSPGPPLPAAGLPAGAFAGGAFLSSFFPGAPLAAATYYI